MTTSLITGTLEDAIRDVLDSGEDAAHDYLRASFLAAAVDTLWRARNEAGLTQTDVARTLGTKQSAIARLEADTGGTLSLHRYVDYCLAVGKFPFDIELAPVRDIQAYARARPDARRTVDEFRPWQQFQEKSISHSTCQSDSVPPESIPEQMEQGVTVAGQQRTMRALSHQNRQASAFSTELSVERLAA